MHLCWVATGGQEFPNSERGGHRGKKELPGPSERHGGTKNTAPYQRAAPTTYSSTAKVFGKGAVCARTHSPIATAQRRKSMDWIKGLGLASFPNTFAVDE